MKLIRIVKFLISWALYAVLLLLAGILFDVWPSFFEGLVVTVATLLSRDFEEWFERKMK
jgi:hypothetical protein